MMSSVNLVLLLKPVSVFLVAKELFSLLQVLYEELKICFRFFLVAKEPQDVFRKELLFILDALTIRFSDFMVSPVLLIGSACCR